MAHHAHSMESGLSVEKDVIAILKLSFDDGAVGDVFFDLFGFVLDFYEVYYLLLFSFVLGGLYYVFHLALLAEVDHPAVVDFVHFFRNCQGGGDFLGNTKLIKSQVGVRTHN